MLFCYICPIEHCVCTVHLHLILLFRYVQVVSHDLSLLLGKSVEARDWLSTVEPRAVRAVMKRIVDDVNLIGKIHITI